MKDYGVKESWSKDFAVKHMIYNGKYQNYYTPIMVLQSGQVLMIVDDEALVLCDLAKRHQKSVQISGIRSGSAFHGIGHVPSLLSLKDVAKGENLKVPISPNQLCYSEFKLCTTLSFVYA